MVFGIFNRNKDKELAIPEGGELQIRTPSPSASVGTAPPQSPDVEAGGSKYTSPCNPLLSGNVQNEPSLPPPLTPAELLSRVKKVPPKTLHDYVIAHILDAPSEASQTLLSFFATLSPPPKIHCVRCHKDYAEVENTDRSCLVPHDDESAEVEHARDVNKAGSKYETNYGCCGKWVEVSIILISFDGWP
jgi:hypothetical protein